MKCKLYICITEKIRERKLRISHFKFQVQEANSINRHRTRSKSELDLYFLVNNLHGKYQIYIRFIYASFQKLKNET